MTAPVSAATSSALPAAVAMSSAVSPCPSAALSSAAGLLKKGPDSRLVLAHVSGGGFVKRERDENPMTVLSVMPTLAELGDVASELGLNVVTPSFMGSEASEIERFLDDFYLVVLRWNAENGGDDGEGGDVE